jgi:hypothetical protein
MNKYFLLILLVLTAAISISAQKTFLIKNASKLFDVKIQIEKCEDATCEGKATVYLMKKNRTAVFQTIPMENLYLELGTDQKPTANLIELYGESNSGIVFEDYNFDNVEDLALQNGDDGPYNSPSYDIFLFSKAANKFVSNDALTSLASDNLGMFDVNDDTKTIETYTKDGCCWHQRTRYRFVNNRLVKIYVFTEDVRSGDGTKVILTTERLVNGKWRRTKKTALTEVYYKEN